MAGDWLKMDCSTPDKPEVFSITSKMGWTDPDLTIGKLFKLWRWFDQHTTEGNAPGVTLALLDHVVGVTNFAECVRSVDWLIVTDAGVMLPNFSRHNGETAKRRALGAKRASSFKSNAKANDESNAASVTNALPREEKRREEKSNTEKESANAPPTPKPAKSTAIEKPEDVGQQVWVDWLTLRKAKKAPATQTVLNSAISEADKAGMALNDFLAVWCARGSQGMEASWIKPDERSHSKPARQAETFAERDQRQAAERIAAICPSIAAKPINHGREVIDITPRKFGALQ